MKIAIVVDRFPALPQTFVLTEITGLLDRGHDVTILSRRRGDRGVIHPSVEAYDLPSRVRYQRYLREHPPASWADKVRVVAGCLLKRPLIVLRSLLVQKFLSLDRFYEAELFLHDEFDVVHCQFGFNGEIATRVRSLGFRWPVLTTFHGYDIRHGMTHGPAEFAELFERGDRLIGISRFSAECLVSLGAPRERITLLSTGINLAEFCSAPVPSADTCPRPLVILSVARLNPVKGLDVAIRAVKELLGAKPGLEIRYRIVGQGSEREALVTLVRDLDLEASVQFLGELSLPDVIEQYRRAHLFLLSSHAEGLPNVLKEAQAVGLPVVATEVGGVSEIVESGRSGFLVAPDDSTAIARELQRLIDQPREWKRLGERGREIVEEKYDAVRSVACLEAIYREIIDGRAPGAESR